MISFQNVTKIYQSGNNKITALDAVSFEVGLGEFVSVVGRSGVGKTTLLRLFLAEERPTNGCIFFEDQDVHQIKIERLPFFRRKIGVIFQDYKLLSSKTTYENIAYVLEVMGRPDEEIKKFVPEVLELTDLQARADSLPEALSGGERQRVAIARALIHRPEIILADEPTGNLDPFQTQDIIKLLAKINQLGTTVILATHNKEIINNLGKRVITLEQGRVIRDEQEGKFML